MRSAAAAHTTIPLLQSSASRARVRDVRTRCEGTHEARFARAAEEEIMVEHDKELDARGLNCPLPILRTKKSLADMSSGQILKILATDAGAVKDFQAFSKQTGNELMEHAEAEGVFTFFMRKK